MNRTICDEQFVIKSVFTDFSWFGSILKEKLCNSFTQLQMITLFDLSLQFTKVSTSSIQPKPASYFWCRILRCWIYFNPIKLATPSTNVFRNVSKMIQECRIMKQSIGLNPHAGQGYLSVQNFSLAISIWKSWYIINQSREIFLYHSWCCIWDQLNIIFYTFNIQ